MDRSEFVELLPSWFKLGDHLRPDQHERLIDDALVLLDRFRWEVAAGFELSPTMQVATVSHAALLTLELPNTIDGYRRVTSIIVHPRPMVRRGPRASNIAGLDTDEETVIVGEAHSRGPILLSWNEVQRQVRLGHRGGNVVLHEFAHRLDMLDGADDGTPAQLDTRLVPSWVDTCTEVYERLRADRHPVIDSYGATNPAEFFAVVTETFFVRPAALHSAEPALYRAFSAFYRQDPRKVK